MMKRLVFLIIVFLMVLPRLPALTVSTSPTSEPFMSIGAAAWHPFYSLLVYGPDPPTAVGQTFQLNAYVKNIDPAWDLYNASFTLAWNNTVIDVLGAPGANVAIDPSWAIMTNDWSVPSQWTFAANYTGTVPPLPNKVLVATLTFTVLIQESSPPYPPAWFDSSLLIFSNVVFWSNTLPIPQLPPEECMVEIYALVAPELPDAGGGGRMPYMD